MKKAIIKDKIGNEIGFSKEEWKAIYSMVKKHGRVEFVNVSYDIILNKLENLAKCHKIDGKEIKIIDVEQKKRNKKQKEYYDNNKVSRAFYKGFKIKSPQKKDKVKHIFTSLRKLNVFVSEYFIKELKRLKYIKKNDGKYDLYDRLKKNNIRFCCAETNTDFFYWLQSDNSFKAISKYLRIYKPLEIIGDYYDHKHKEFKWVELKELPTNVKVK